MRDALGRASRPFAWAAVAVALSWITGCANPCGDLQAICDECSDPNKKAACELSVDEHTDDVCEQNIESYGTICP